MGIFYTTGKVNDDPNQAAVQKAAAQTAATTNNSVLGNGGMNYNTATTDLKKQIVQNQMKLNTDPNYNQNEVSRALQVIQNRQAQGLDVTAQNKYLTQNLGYKAPGTNTATTFSGNGIGSASQVKSNTGQSSELMDLMKQIATKQSPEFSYDPNSDPAYQAALQRARANIDDGNSAAQAEMNRRGILNSTITSDRMGEIASKEMGNVETTVVPQLMQQAYQKYIDAQNQENQRFANMGNLAGMYNSEDQRAIDNNFSESDRTGYYVPEAAKPIISNILQLKQQAETKGITAAERAKLSAQADGYRAQLLAMGVDASAYSASVSHNNASLNPGIRTLQGQQLDMSKKDQQFNQGMDTRKQNFLEGQQSWENSYRVARDAITDKVTQQKFNEDVRQFGLSYGLQSLQAQNQQAYQQAQIALSQDDNSRQWLQTNYNISKPDKAVTGATAESYATSYLDKAAKYDSDDGTLQNPGVIERQILSSGLSDTEMYKLYQRYGLKWDGTAPK